MYTNSSGASFGGVLRGNELHFCEFRSVGQKIIYLDTNQFNSFKTLLNEGVKAGSTSLYDIVSTYSLVYTRSGAYAGCVISIDGDIHFIPLSANRGQKISSTSVVSTYSLVYTTSEAYSGGVLSPSGKAIFYSI